MLDEDLRQAVLAQDVDACRAAIAGGADVNAISGGWSNLHWACDKGSSDVCRVLIEAGADLAGGTGPTFWSPLMIACERGHLEACEVLLKAGADPKIRASSGETAMSLAGSAGHFAVCSTLIRLGFPVAHRDTHGRTALIEAASEGRVDVCKLLLDAGSDMRSVSHAGWNALLAAVAKDRLGVCKLLLERGADPAETVAVHGHSPMTAFQMAVHCGAVAVAGYFLSELGEDPAQRTGTGRTMSQIAGKNVEVKALLNAAKTSRQVRRTLTSVPGEAGDSLLRPSSSSTRSPL
jgi:ankyrin repeat protein